MKRPLGAQLIQLFDSWAHHLSPDQFCDFSLPYIEEILQTIHSKYPNVPLIIHMNGGTGKLELMEQCSADVISLDWHIDMATARKLLNNRVIQVSAFVWLSKCVLRAMWIPLSFVGQKHPLQKL